MRTRAEQLAFRATAEEKQQILRNAEAVGMKLQDYLLSVAMANPVANHINPDTVGTSVANHEGEGVVIKGIEARTILAKADKQDDTWVLYEGKLYIKHKTSKGTVQLAYECDVPAKVAILHPLQELHRVAKKHTAVWDKLNQLLGIELLTDKQQQWLQQEIDRDTPYNVIADEALDYIQQQQPEVTSQLQVDLPTTPTYTKYEFKAMYPELASAKAYGDACKLARTSLTTKDGKVWTRKGTGDMSVWCIVLQSDIRKLETLTV
ncbi:hypothetical protein DSM106972_009260 [Dulcicalothrix desertica PCC 7102]|uniref:Uncharacterized protein n=1 Tax=Dulcicalothrix desertica PCC 7102 TaxID=232991 RepID=A0A3S1CUB8_9CYAN|nr:hypothetical protein [Dulcicalothrix desertica]RUT08873.1 hypothetical protein DSM106972_009260 [Dulcicalothrix desertica PCC 7102]TWH44111.1 hypothetical protein CAL7102_07889 [Dulcicalothrix desertica PCC 7102]